MIGKIFITRSGYDPQLGRHVKDPYLGSKPSLGACRPDIRRQVDLGDYIFVVSGKISSASQYVMCGFEIVQKVDARDAYVIFPERRLHLLEDGQISGNIIVNSNGLQHSLDDHQTFTNRLPNYLVGNKNLAPTSSNGIARARAQTNEVLREILHKDGNSPFEIVGRWGSQLDESQVNDMCSWLHSLDYSK